MLEPDARTISEAYWEQWLRAYPAPDHGLRRTDREAIELGVAYLRNRFCRPVGHAWVESIERSVAAAYHGRGLADGAAVDDRASDRAALDILMRRTVRATIRGCRADRHC